MRRDAILLQYELFKEVENLKSSPYSGVGCKRCNTPSKFDIDQYITHKISISTQYCLAVHYTTGETKYAFIHKMELAKPVIFLWIEWLAWNYSPAYSLAAINTNIKSFCILYTHLKKFPLHANYIYPWLIEPADSGLHSQWLPSFTCINFFVLLLLLLLSMLLISRSKDVWKIIKFDW